MKKTINELKNEFLEEYGEKANKVLHLYNTNPNLMRHLSEICKKEADTSKARNPYYDEMKKSGIEYDDILLFKEFDKALRKRESVNIHNVANLKPHRVLLF